jgi:hypothetical protein
MTELFNGVKLLHFKVKNTEFTLLEPIYSVDIIINKSSEFLEYAIHP